MLHSLLSGLPDIEDEQVEGEDARPAKLEVKSKSTAHESPANPVNIPLPESTTTSLAGSKIMPVTEDQKSSDADLEGQEGHASSVDEVTIDESLLHQLQVQQESEFESEQNLTLGHSTPLYTPSPHHSRTPSPSQSQTHQSHPHPHTSRPHIPLATLLTQTDNLLASFPPTHPALHLAEIMGPRSVFFTWGEDPFAASIGSDKWAEEIVGNTLTGEGGVVLEFEGSDAEGESDEDEEQKEKDEKHHGRRRGDSLPFRKSTATFIDKKTAIAGVILVAGIAIAVYNAKYGGLGKHGRHGDAFDWKKIGQVIGGAVIGMGEKINVFGE